MPYLIGNPIYHWSHLELKEYFGIEETLSEKNAEEIWNRCNEIIQSPDFSARTMIEKSNVKYIRSKTWTNLAIKVLIFRYCNMPF